LGMKNPNSGISPVSTLKAVLVPYKARLNFRSPLTITKIFAHRMISQTPLLALPITFGLWKNGNTTK
jgi:hypothetical protein